MKLLRLTLAGVASWVVLTLAAESAEQIPGNAVVIGVPMFGRTQSFLPVQACTEVTVTMLRLGDLTLQPGCESQR